MKDSDVLFEKGQRVSKVVNGTESSMDFKAEHELSPELEVHF